MHYIADIFEFSLSALLMVIVVIYAPFAKSTKRAFRVVVTSGFVWGVTSIIASIVFNEESSPFIGYLIVPPIIGVIAVALRLTKIALFEIFPFLENLEARFRKK